jgi:hypothetical protein
MDDTSDWRLTSAHLLLVTGTTAMGVLTSARSLLLCQPPAMEVLTSVVAECSKHHFLPKFKLFNISIQNSKISNFINKTYNIINKFKNIYSNHIFLKLNMRGFSYCNFIKEPNKELCRVCTKSTHVTNMLAKCGVIILNLV